MGEASTNNTSDIYVEYEDKEQLLERYLDIVFVDDVSKLCCARCGRVLIHHYVANCGHLFCRNCQRILSHGKGWKCPECREYITHFGDQKVEVEELVYSLMVHCLNHKYGCKQIMPLRQIARHLKVCEDTKEANLPMFYAGTNSLETVMKRMGEMAEEMKQLRESIDQSQKQTQDLLLHKIKETDEEQRTDNEIKFSHFESRINGLRSDLQVNTTRLQNAIDDKHNEIIKELESKWSMMEETTNLYKNDSEDFEGLRDLILKSETVIDDKMKHLEDQQRDDAERMEQKMQRWNNNLLTQTTRLQTQIEERCNQKLKDHDAEKKKYVKDQIDTSHSLIEKNIIKVADNQRKYKEQLEKKMERLNKDILEIARLQKKTEDRCIQKIRDKSKRLKQKLDQTLSKVDQVYNQMRMMIIEINRLKADIDKVRELQHSYEKALSELDNKWMQKQASSTQLQNTVDQLKHDVENLRQSLPLITSTFEDGSRSTTTINVYNTPESTPKSKMFFEHTKTACHTVDSLRITESRTWEEKSSYTYKEFVQSREKYKVPEYNMLLLAESAAEITKFINCFEVLTKYDTLDDAIGIYYPVKQLVSTPFKIHDIEGEDKQIIYDEIDDNEMADLKTKQCKSHHYLFKEYLVRFIDSAGYGTTTSEEGQPDKQLMKKDQKTKGDKRLLQDICNFTSKLQSLHSIVLVMKSTEVTYSPIFLNSVKALLSDLSQTRENNLLFVITDFDDTSLNKVKVNAAAEKLLKNITPKGEVTVDYSKNTFFIPNKGLQSVMAQRQGVRESEEEMATARMMWQIAGEQCQSLVTHVQQLKPWKTRFFKQYFYA